MLYFIPTHVFRQTAFGVREKRTHLVTNDPLTPIFLRHHPSMNAAQVTSDFLSINPAAWFEM